MLCCYPFWNDILNDRDYAARSTHKGIQLIGASLSEPHTSGTALRKCACIIYLYVRACFMHETLLWELLPKWALATQSEVKAWQLTFGLYFYQPSTAGHSQAVLIWTVFEVASGKSLSCMAWTALINARNSAHDFIIKLSPCMCSYISCPGWRMADICDTWLSRVRT